jgi:GNAT superfamily N-acetyltransferase
VLIRAATADDARAIVRVQAETWRVAYRRILPNLVLERVFQPDVVERWVAHMFDPDGRTFVAEEAGTVVGFVSAGPSRDEDLAGTDEVYALYVLPPEQGRGLGAALLDAAGGDSLWVLAANAAGRAFYEHQGWRYDTEREEPFLGVPLRQVRYRRAT